MALVDHPMQNQNEFFLVSLPGLEDLVAAEVKDWFPEFEARVEYGGVTVLAPMSEGLKMNLVLKIPTRILLRVTKFRCRDFPKLYRKVSEFPWHKWLDTSAGMEVFAASKQSRLKIKSRIEETCIDAWRAQQEESDTTKKAKLYVRVVNDEVALSLDTSGERLHKRGLRQHIGEAPLRETIAAAMLQMVARSMDASENRGIELVDPMMGSGTFLLEAVTRDAVIDAREFAFERFAQQPRGIPILKTIRPQFTNLIGYERDTDTLRAAKLNLASCKNGTPVEFRREDFFSAAPLPLTLPERVRWVITNPPYGERLKVDEPLSTYYGKLFAAAERVAHPDRACFLLPAKAVKGKFALPISWKVLEKRRFLNGGIPVVAFVFGRKPL